MPPLSIDRLPVIRSHKGMRPQDRSVGESIERFKDAPTFSVRAAGASCEEVRQVLAAELQRANKTGDVIGVTETRDKLRIVRLFPRGGKAIVDIAMHQEGPNLYIQMNHYAYLPRTIFNSLVWLLIGATLLSVAVFLVVCMIVEITTIAVTLGGPIGFLFLMAFISLLSDRLRLSNEEGTQAASLRASVITSLYASINALGFSEIDIVDLERK